MDVDALTQLADVIKPAGDDIPDLVAAASKLGDLQLEQQLRVVDLFSKALPAGVALSKMFSSIVRLTDPEDFKSKMHEIYGLLKNASTFSALLQRLMTMRTGEVRWDTAFQPLPQKSLNHMDVLDGVFKAEFTLVNLSDELSGLLGAVREWIEGNVVKLSELMASYCPEWKSCEDTLLENPSVVDALLNNKSYNDIGPSKTKLDEWLDFSKGCRKKGNFPIRPTILHEAKAIVAHAEQTVCLTYALNTIVNVLPGVRNWNGSALARSPPPQYSYQQHKTNI